MDQTLIVVLALALAFAVLMIAVASIIARPKATAGQAAADSPIAASTEGMKVCPACGMGNLWTERTCSACGKALKG
jgi:hypothetical protein